MQWGRCWGHEWAGLKTPQKLLIVAAQPLLFSALLLHRLMEIGVLLGQLPAEMGTPLQFLSNIGLFIKMLDVRPLQKGEKYGPTHFLDDLTLIIWTDLRAFFLPGDGEVNLNLR